MSKKILKLKEAIELLESFAYSDDKSVRKKLASAGIRLDKLQNDSNDYVRAEVANQGYGLKKLIKDKAWIVRTQVANQAYGLDILIYDDHEEVREAAREKMDKPIPRKRLTYHKVTGMYEEMLDKLHQPVCNIPASYILEELDHERYEAGLKDYYHSIRDRYYCEELENKLADNLKKELLAIEEELKGKGAKQ